MTAPRIVIASPGIGRVQRGFERLFGDLFRLMRDDFEITLLKGGGARAPRERVPPFVHRNSPLLTLLPVHKLFGRTPYHTECMLFALGMLPLLRDGRIDIVHTIDPPLTRLLFRMRARLGLKFTLLYTEGTAMPPSDYPPADHTHFINRLGLDQALAHGYRPDAMTLIPAGFYPERFDIPAEKAGLRKAYGISPATFVVLAVAAINRSQKRADYLIDEMAGLPGDWLLMMDGSLDHGDPDLVPYARRKLGDRVRISHVASEKVAELYKLADVLVHVSRFEAFGIAIVEAASTGLPIITHDGPHFRWLIQTPASWINADRQGALAERIRQAMSDPAILESMRAPDVVRERFSWHGLKSDYGSLYRHVARLPRQGAPEADCRRVA